MDMAHKLGHIHELGPENHTVFLTDLIFHKCHYNVNYLYWLDIAFTVI